MPGPSIARSNENDAFAGELPPGAGRDEAVRMALLDRVLSNHRPLPILFVSLAAMMAATLEHGGPTVVVLIWVLVTAGIWAEIAWMTGRYFRGEFPADPAAMQRRLSVRYLLANFCWTAALPLFWVTGNDQQNFVLMVAFIAHVSIATATTSVNWRVFLVCTLPIVVALITACFAAGTTPYLSTGLLLSAAYGYLVTVARKSVDQAENSLRLRFENNDLIRDLAGAKAASDSALKEAKAANTLLSEREQRFRALVDNAFDGILITSEEGIVTFATDAVGRIVGIPPEALLGHKLDGSAPANMEEGVLQDICDVCSTPGSRKKIRGWLTSHDGEEHWIEATGRNLLDDPSVRGVIFNIRDATDRKRADDELKLHLRVLEILATGAPLSDVLNELVLAAEEIFPGMRAAVFLSDEKNHLNVAAAPNLPESFRQTTSSIEIRPDACSCGAAAWRGEPVMTNDIEADTSWSGCRAAAREAGVRACWSYPIVGRDGTVLGTLSMHYSAPRSPGEWERNFFRGAAQLTAVAIERRRAEKRLAEALKNAEIANHSKSQFLANMSHELRTPLNAIIGFSEIMNEAMFGELNVPEYRTYVRDIHMSGRHLLSLINDILDISKIEAGQMELDEVWVDLHEVAEWSVELVHHKSQSEGVAIKLDMAPDLPQIFADERAIKQILLNLISNATKFTPKGGTVTVGARVEEDGRFALSVSDTGIGIPRHMIARVLEPFGQAEGPMARKFGGTGLGLPITMSLAEMHGGELTLESEPDVGTTVTVHLPAGRVQTSLDGGAVHTDTGAA